MFFKELKVLMALSAFFSVNAFAVDNYNSVNRQLTINQVLVGNIVYTNVVVTVDSVVSVGATPSTLTYNTYNAANGQLTIPSVLVEGITYYDVVIILGNIISIGGQSTVDNYNLANDQLTINQILVGDVIYKDVVVKVASVVSIGTAPSTLIYDTYNAVNRQLRIASVLVEGKIYYDVVIAVGDVVSIGASDNAYFSSIPVSIIGINDVNACFLKFLSAVDFDGDGNKDLAVHFWCPQWNKITGFDGPTPDLFRVYLNKKNHFEDGNQLIFGIKDVSLGGASRKVIQADLNGDGKIDLAYAINREDGRPIGSNTSVVAAQSVILNSKSGGGYSVSKVGVPDWFHNVDIYQTGTSTPSVVFAGLTNIGTQPFSLNGSNWTPSTFLLPHLSGLTYRFMKSSPLLKADDLIISVGLSEASNLELSIYLNGAWINGVGYRPVVTANAVLMKTWNGDIASVNRIDIGGASYVAAGFDESCRLNKSPNSSQTFVGRFSGRKLPDNYSGGQVVEIDMPQYSELMAFQVNNGKIEKVSLGLNEPISQDMLHNFDCVDVNSDGYDDIVITYQRKGGVPDVFINDKNGGFKKIPSTVFPKSVFSENGRGIITDVDGDGIGDLIIFTIESIPQSIHVYNGTKKNSLLIDLMRCLRHIYLAKAIIGEQDRLTRYDLKFVDTKKPAFSLAFYRPQDFFNPLSYRRSYRAKFLNILHFAGRSRATLAAREIHAKLLELAVQMGTFQTGFFSDTGHRAPFFGQVKFKIRFLKLIACITQGLFE